MSDFLFVGFLLVFVVIVLYATVIYPSKMQERVQIEALRTYQMELQTGVKHNKLESLLKDSGYLNKPIEEPESENGKDN